ncbi:MAG: aldo/keto reductase [Nitrososphaeria archaeon]|nr:aldo/keto reductase [Nitrososphaeria archaeon]
MNMRYHVLGRTGLHVSELGIGGHEYRRWLNPNHFNIERDDKEFYNTQEERNTLIKKALDAGINYFDTTLKEEVESLGLALKKWDKRKDAIVAIMAIFPFKKLKDSPKSRWRDIILDEIEARLKLLYTDYADIFNVHMPEDNYTREYFTFVIELLNELKGMGKIRAIGASTHEPAFLAELIRKYDCFDTVMVGYNYFMKDAKDILFPICKAHNVGVVVMKPISWPYYGIPISYFQENRNIQYNYTPAQASIKWILDTQEVSTVVPSVNSIQELEENINTFSIKEPLDENILVECLKTALSEKGKEILKRLAQHPYKDISGYAKKALDGWKVI